MQTCIFDFFKSSSGTRALSPELLNVGDDDSADIPIVQGEVPPPQIVICQSDVIIFLKFFHKSVLTNATSLVTTYNLTSGDDINYREDCSVLGHCYIDWLYPRKL